MNRLDPQQIAPHLITDTGVWRLTVDISERSLQAWLRRPGEDDEEAYALARTVWSGDDSLRSVENAVYDNPLILNDFEADIVITTPRYLFVPAGLNGNSRALQTCYEQVFESVGADDLMADEMGEYLCLYTLMPGLKPFLSRTFAGSRISSHVSRLDALWREYAGEGVAVMVDLRGESVDIGVYRDGALQGMCSREYAAADDILYYVLNTARTLGGIDTKQATLKISSGVADNLDEVKDMLGEFFGSVSEISLPSGVRMPTAAMLCSYRKTKTI